MSYEKGRFSLTLSMSPSATRPRLARLRFCLADLQESKCRRPAFVRKTLPEAVTLNRFATAFLVLLRAMDFGMGPGRIATNRRNAMEFSIKIRLGCRWDYFARFSASALICLTVFLASPRAAPLASTASLDFGST